MGTQTRIRLYFLVGALVLPFVLVTAFVWLRLYFVPHDSDLDLIIGVASLSAGCSCAIKCSATSKGSIVDHLVLVVSYLLMYGPLLFVGYFVLLGFMTFGKPWF